MGVRAWTARSAALASILAQTACAGISTPVVGNAAAAGVADPPNPLMAQIGGTADLEVLNDAGWHRDNGSVIFEGDVTNETDHTIAGITVRVRYYTNDLQLAQQADGSLDIDPLAAGQTSHFSVISDDDPSISQATVEFRDPNGTLNAMSES